MAFETIHLDVHVCTCERCGHTWIAQIEQEEGQWKSQFPRCCGRCKNPGWDVKRHTNNGILYVIGNVEGGMYKIGVSTDTVKRLQSLQTGSPLELTIVGQKFVDDMFKAEREAHKKMAAHRLRGEWFKLTQDQALSVVA